MTDRLWFYNSSVLQSVMLSKDIEKVCTNVPAINKVKIKVTFSGRSLRVVVLIFFFLFLVGCVKTKDLCTGPVRSQAQPGARGGKNQSVRKRFVYSFDLFDRFTALTFLDAWSAELAKPNLIDLSFKRFAPHGGLLHYKKALRPTLAHTSRLAYFDPGLEYFVQDPAQSVLFISIKGP